MTQTATTRDQRLEHPLPHSPEAERALLGSVMLDNRLMNEAAAELARHAPQVFYLHAHARIFSAMLELYNENSEINPVLIGEKLRVAGALEQTGGITFISELTYGLPHITNLKTYIDLLRRKLLRRAIIRAANRITSQALDDEEEPEAQILADADEMLIALREMQTTSERADATLREIGVDARAYIEQIERGEEVAISTGIEELDRRTRGGIHPEQLWLIVALEKQGKSALMQQILRNVARRGEEAMLFSFEMSALENYLRMLSAMSGVPAFHINKGIGDEELFRLKNALDDVDNLPITINTTAFNIMEARARIRERKRKAEERGKRLSVVAWDYLQLMEGRGSVAIENRTHELEFISRQMKRICAEFQIGGIAISQFNNEAGKQAALGQRPQIHHIHGGGEIRKACDVGCVLHTVLPKKNDKGIRKSTLYIDLQRNAPPAVVPLWLDGKTLEFSPRVKDEGAGDERGDDELTLAREAVPPRSPAPLLSDDDLFGDKEW